MARAKVVHSQDAVTVLFRGNKKSPEPTTGVIRFPGGRVEVSRTTEGSYWAHISVDEGAELVSSRVDYDLEQWRANFLAGEPTIPDIPAQEHIVKLAILVDGKFKEAN